MQEFLKEVAINILVDITSKFVLWFVGLFLVASGGSGILDWFDVINEGRYMNPIVLYFFIPLFITGIILLVYESYKSKIFGVGIRIEEKDSKESLDMWNNPYSIWLEIKNDNKNADYKDCFAYLKLLDDNGINLLPKVTNITNKFSWENYAQSQEKTVRSGDKERVNISFSNGGRLDEKYFCFEGKQNVTVPSKERIKIEIIVSGKIKGIRKEFSICGYLVHEMLDYEKTITKRFYIDCILRP